MHLVVVVAPPSMRSAPPLKSALTTRLNSKRQLSKVGDPRIRAPPPPSFAELRNTWQLRTVGEPEISSPAPRLFGVPAFAFPPRIVKPSRIVAAVIPAGASTML